MKAWSSGVSYYTDMLCTNPTVGCHFFIQKVESSEGWWWMWWEGINVGIGLDSGPTKCGPRGLLGTGTCLVDAGPNWNWISLVSRHNNSCKYSSSFSNSFSFFLSLSSQFFFFSLPSFVFWLRLFKSLSTLIYHII